MLKAIGTAARKEIEGLLGTRVFLELFVKVQRSGAPAAGSSRSGLAASVGADRDQTTTRRIKTHIKIKMTSELDMMRQIM